MKTLTESIQSKIKGDKMVSSFDLNNTVQSPPASLGLNRMIELFHLIPVNIEKQIKRLNIDLTASKLIL